MEYGPELYRKTVERCGRETGPSAGADRDELQQRVERLEKLLLEQEEIIKAAVAKHDLMEKRCQELEGQLTLFRIVAAALALGCIILLAILFK
jgi:hypothetical protein